MAEVKQFLNNRQIFCLNRRIHLVGALLWYSKWGDRMLENYMSCEIPILKFVLLYNYSQKCRDLFIVKLAPTVGAICRKEICWIKMCSWHDMHTAMMWEKLSRICKALWFNRFQIRLYCSKTCWTVIAIFPCFLLFQTETKLGRYSAYVIFSFSKKNHLLDWAMSKHFIKIIPRCVPYFLPSYYLNGDLHAKETQVYRNSVNPSSPKIDILGFYFFYWNKKCSSLLFSWMSWGVEDTQVPRRCKPEVSGIVQHAPSCMRPFSSLQLTNQFYFL